MRKGAIQLLKSLPIYTATILLCAWMITLYAAVLYDDADLGVFSIVSLIITSIFLGRYTHATSGISDDA